MALFQIDGISGTGKTTLAEVLTRRGLKAIDVTRPPEVVADEIVQAADYYR